MRRFCSLLVGAVVGALVGSTLILLFAPSSGEELRNQLRERFRRLGEDIKQAGLQKRAELEHQLNTLRAGVPIEKE